MQPRTLKLGIAALSAAAAALLALGCHSGTPAAPEGSEILLSCEFVPGTRNPLTGDFEARITARVLDQASNVPQVGVAVFFRVVSGPGAFVQPEPVRTTNAGLAQNVLVATGATTSNRITIEAFSGEAVAGELQLDVNGCQVTVRTPPEATLTVTPSSPTTTMDVTVDVGASSAPECPGTDPDQWMVNWGDGSAAQTFDFSMPTATHRYTTTGMFTITVTVEDCNGLSDDAVQTITVN